LSIENRTPSRSPGGLLFRWGGTLVLAIVALGIGYEVSSRRENRALAVALTRGDPDRAPPLLRRYGCTGCHTVPALTGADGKVAPPLAQLRKRIYIAGRLENTPQNLVRWIVSPQSLAPDSAMPDTGVTEDEARDIAAFLYDH
jgi:cytochrome c